MCISILWDTLKISYFCWNRLSDKLFAGVHMTCCSLSKRFRQNRFTVFGCYWTKWPKLIEQFWYFLCVPASGVPVFLRICKLTHPQKICFWGNQNGFLHKTFWKSTASIHKTGWVHSIIKWKPPIKVPWDRAGNQLPLKTFLKLRACVRTLQPAVDRQPGHRRGDREEVGRNIP